MSTGGYGKWRKPEKIVSENKGKLSNLMVMATKVNRFRLRKIFYTFDGILWIILSALQRIWCFATAPSNTASLILELRQAGWRSFYST